MKRLKIILQSKHLYLLLIIISIIYVFVSTVLIKYESKYSNQIKLDCIVNTYKIDGDKVTINVSCDNEQIVGNYYLKSIDEKNDISNNLKNGSRIILI